MTDALPSVRQRLLDAGLLELNLHGIQDFSVRRVAAACGVSSAAPYKHFLDKNRFISNIIDSVIRRWEAQIPGILARHPNNPEEQLIEVAVRYVQFLVENSHFRSIIMLKTPAMENQFFDMRHRLSRTSRDLIEAYAATRDFTKETVLFKLYLCRSLVYGAALMFDNGEIPYTEETLNYVRRGIRRELQLP